MSGYYLDEGLPRPKATPLDAAYWAGLEENELRMGMLLPAFRISLTGLGMGPSLFDIAALLGKEKTIARLETALKTIK